MVRSFIYCMRSLSSKNVCTYLILNRLNTTSAMLMLASARISTRASWIIVWWWQRRRRRRRRRAFSGCERCWIEFAFRVRHTNIMYLCVCWLSALALNKYCASKSTAAASPLSSLRCHFCYFTRFGFSRVLRLFSLTWKHTDDDDTGALNNNNNIYMV